MDKMVDYIKKNWKLALIFCLMIGTICVLSIFILQMRGEDKKISPDKDLIEELLADNAIDAENGTQEDASKPEQGNDLSTNEKEPIIIVDIKGEVKAPGVYQMDLESRVIDVIDKAGGLSEEAETTAVNFAQIVSDQMVIYIPKIGEETAQINDASQNQSNEKSDTNAKVNINQADKETLMTLNGIGPSKAESIISYREENGSFQAIDEIKNVSGIGEATFEKLKDMIIVEP